MSTECSRPAWFIELERDLHAPVKVPDGAAIDWDRCRDLFLIPLLQRLESRSNSPHPAIVRGLLEQRLTGEDVEAKLKATTAAAAYASAAAAAAERADQLADLQAALAASTQQPALPGNYIVDLASPAEVQP